MPEFPSSLRPGDRVAWPGDPGLDAHLSGLRINEILVPDAGRTEMMMVFDATIAVGYWIQTETGDRLIPDDTTYITAIFIVPPGYRRWFDGIIAKLQAWQAAGELVALTAAPGKWTLLHCPGYPPGPSVVIPGTDHYDDA